MPRKTSAKKAAPAPRKARAVAEDAPQQQGTVKAMDVSLVGQGASGSANLANRVEAAMNEAFEAAQQRGETDPKRLLQAKVDARKAVLDSL
jgi:hypothetical protein